MKLTIGINWFWAILILPCLTKGMSQKTAYSPREMSEDGDVVVGFAYAGSNRNNADLEPCGKTYHHKRVPQGWEVVKFIVSKINNNSDILPGIKLGYRIVDVCRKKSTNIVNTLQLVPRESQPSNRNITDARIIMVFGPSEYTIPIVYTLTSFALPSVGIQASSQFLSNKEEFPYFMRMVPSDQYQAQAMVSILEYFNWTYVLAIYSDDAYGSRGFLFLNRFRKRAGICIVALQVFEEKSPDEEYKDTAKYFSRKTGANVIVSFAGEHYIKKFKSALKELGLYDRYIWVGSDAFEVNTDAKDSLWIMFKASLPAGFEEHYLSLNPMKRPDNPWLKDLWVDLFNCTWNMTKSLKSYCGQYTDMNQTKVEHVIVKSFGLMAGGLEVAALGMHAMIQHECPNATGNKTLLDYCLRDGPLLYNYTKHVTTPKYRFDENGDRLTEYSIMQQKVKPDGSCCKNEKIGLWSMVDKGLHIQKETLTWFETNGTQNIPESVCSKPCKQNEIYYLEDLPCCWECRQCRANEIVKTNQTECKVCAKFTWPDATYHACEAIVPEHISYSNPVTVTILVLSIIGIATCIVTFGIYIRNSHKKILRASSLDLSYFILIGIACTFATAFSFCIDPGQFVCYWRQLGFSISFSLIYAPLLTKASRIYRIFSATKTFKQAKRCMSMGSVIFTAGTLCSVQVILSVGLLLATPPTMITKMPVATEKYVEMTCGLPVWVLITTLAYNVILVMITIVLSFLTRKLPANFNESLHMFLSVCATLFLWIAFIPMYFAAFYEAHKSLLFALALILNATVSLVCLFCPRIYAVYFVEEMLHRSSTFKDPSGDATTVTSSKRESTTTSIPTKRNSDPNNKSTQTSPKEIPISSILTHEIDNKGNEPFNQTSKGTEDVELTQKVNFHEAVIELSDMKTPAYVSSIQIDNPIFTLDELQEMAV